jgi:hypothetical protein
MRDLNDLNDLNCSLLVGSIARFDVGDVIGCEQHSETLIGGVETSLCIDLYTDLLHSIFSQGNYVDLDVSLEVEPITELLGNT